MKTRGKCGFGGGFRPMGHDSIVPVTLETCPTIKNRKPLIRRS